MPDKKSKKKRPKKEKKNYVKQRHDNFQDFKFYCKRKGKKIIWDFDFDHDMTLDLTMDF